MGAYVEVEDEGILEGISICVTRGFKPQKVGHFSHTSESEFVKVERADFLNSRV